MTAKISRSADGTDLYSKIDAKTVRGDGCWGWRGSYLDGYAATHAPRVDRKYKTFRVSRVVLARKLGRDLAPGECACHSCDNPGCVNPDHLWAGTYSDNARDRDAKGRGAHFGPLGSTNGQAKITKDQVYEIRAATGTQKEIAARFGIGQSQVSQIKTGNAGSICRGL
jgi:hypothetical protein